MKALEREGQSYQENGRTRNTPSHGGICVCRHKIHQLEQQQQKTDVQTRSGSISTELAEHEWRVFSMFVGQDELDAAINDELQPPLAYAELADPDDSSPWAYVIDRDDQVMARQKEYETNLAHVNHVVQLR